MEIFPDVKAERQEELCMSPFRRIYAAGEFLILYRWKEGRSLGAEFRALWRAVSSDKKIWWQRVNDAAVRT